MLGRGSSHCTTNYPAAEYDAASLPDLVGKSRDEVKAALKTERAKAPRRRFCSRARTSRFMGVGSSNRRNQWQARILVHGKVTHLGYYGAEEDAARVYDRVALALHGAEAQTNFPPEAYGADPAAATFSGLGREALQRALGVKPMDKSSQFRGVSRKKGRWEAKVMVERRWAYRELFDTEAEAARAYDAAVWRLKPTEARSYVNFKGEGPPGGPHAGGGVLSDAPTPPPPKRRRAAGTPPDGTPSPLGARSLPPLAPGAGGGAPRGGGGAAAVRRLSSRALPVLIDHPAAAPPSPLARAIARTMSEPDLAAAAAAGGGFVFSAAPPPRPPPFAGPASAPHRPPSPGMRHSASLSALQYVDGAGAPGAPPPLTVRVGGPPPGSFAHHHAASMHRLGAPAPLDVGAHPHAAPAAALLASGLTPPAGITPRSAAFASVLLTGLGASGHTPRAGAGGGAEPDSPFRASVQIGGEDLGLFGGGLDDPLTPRGLLGTTPRAPGQ